MLYRYFTVTPDYKVQEQTAEDMEVVEDHAQIVCGTNDKLEYEDYTVYFNNTKVGSANFAVGNIGAYGTLVFCIGEDSDKVWTIKQHFKSLESDEEYKGLFSKENASFLTTLEDFSDTVIIMIGGEPGKYIEPQPGFRIKKYEENKSEVLNNLALLVRDWLVKNNMLGDSFIIFGGKGYIRHRWSKDDNSLSYYEQKSSEDTPKEFEMIIGMSERAAELAGPDLENIDLFGVKRASQCLYYEHLNKTTWVIYSSFYD